MKGTKDNSNSIKKRPKNIILCSDGTGNTANKNRGTNVFKLFELIATECDPAVNDVEQQIVFYDDGVGSQRGRALNMAFGAIGLGLSRNVRQLYTHLARVYEPGDNIFLFGFSRGAFTVRTLAGFINQMGIPNREEIQSDQELIKIVKKLYKRYRNNYTTIFQDGYTHVKNRALASSKADNSADKSGRKNKTISTDNSTSQSNSDIETKSESSTSGDSANENKSQQTREQEICFVGVWDTVDAVGFPIPFVATIVNTLIYRYKFPDNYLPNNIATARQVLAIDDERKTFQPELWQWDTPTSNGVSSRDKRIKQVWFSGAHSDIGGGYRRHGLSLCTLKWMLEEAQDCGLVLDCVRLTNLIQGANEFDELHDSRSGISSYYRYSPRLIAWLHKKVIAKRQSLAEKMTAVISQSNDSNNNESPHDELEANRILLLNHNLNNPCEDKLEGLPTVHISVLRRIVAQVNGYAPGNFPAHCNIEGLKEADNIKFRQAISDYHNSYGLLVADHLNPDMDRTGVQDSPDSQKESITEWLRKPNVYSIRKAIRNKSPLLRNSRIHSMLDYSAMRIGIRQWVQYLFLSLVGFTLYKTYSDKNNPKLSKPEQALEELNPIAESIGLEKPLGFLVQAYLLNPALVSATLFSGVAAYFIGLLARRSLEKSYSKFWVGFFNKHPEFRNLFL